MSAPGGHGQGRSWPGTAAAENTLWQQVTLRERQPGARHPLRSDNDSHFGQGEPEAGSAPPAPADGLTGLPGPLALRQELQHRIERATGSMRGFALLYVDIDHYGRVRQSVGNGGGDQVLARVAHRLRGSMRSIDWLARLDVHGFAVLLAETSSVDAAARTARMIAARIGRPIETEGSFVMLTASVGVALFGPDGCTVPELTRAAAAAVACASRGGGRQVVVHAGGRSIAASGRRGPAATSEA